MWGATIQPWMFGHGETISIHAPRVGSDVFSGVVASMMFVFQSTLPVWGATPEPLTGRTAQRHFNPRSPCGERRRYKVQDFPGLLFQSTLPVWGATAGNGVVFAKIHISIHAPRVGSDCNSIRQRFDQSHFNPRSPCGERRLAIQTEPYFRYFNPRSPCGERPTNTSHVPQELQFQSTLPVWGATSLYAYSLRPQAFQSTLPVWGATPFDVTVTVTVAISIHAPRVGSDDIVPFTTFHDAQISIHAPRVGSDAQEIPIFRGVADISIHAPRVGSDKILHIQGAKVEDFNPRSPCGERLCCIRPN